MPLTLVHSVASHPSPLAAAQWELSRRLVHTKLALKTEPAIKVAVTVVLLQFHTKTVVLHLMAVEIKTPQIA